MRTIKQFFLFALMFAQPALLRAQDCNFDINKKDTHTNEIIRAITLPIGPHSYSWTITLEQRGEKYAFSLAIKWGEKFKDTILRGDKISFLLEDGNKVVMVANKVYLPSYVIDNHGEEITTYFPKGELQKSGLELLSKSPIDKIRIKLGGETREVTKISGRETKDIMKAAKCLLQN
jgi:hypothetical protein